MKFKRVLAVVLASALSFGSVMPCMAMEPVVVREGQETGQVVEQEEMQGSDGVVVLEESEVPEGNQETLPDEEEPEVKQEERTVEQTGEDASQQILAEDVGVASIGTEFDEGDFKYIVTADGEVKVKDISLYGPEDVVIPAEVVHGGVTYRVVGTEVGAGEKCWNVRTVTVSMGVTDIGDYSFENMENLEYITIEDPSATCKTIDGVMYSADGTVLKCYPPSRAGDSFTIPDTVTTLDICAIFYPKFLVTITIPDSVTTYEMSSLAGLQKVETLVLGYGTASIGQGVINDCPNLKELTLRGSFSVGMSSIKDCPKLEKIILDGDITWVIGWVFYNLPSLCEYQVVNSENFKSVDGVLYNDDRLWYYPPAKEGDTYVVPEGTSVIGPLAFSYPQNLRKVILPQGISLKSGAFNSSVHPLDVYLRDEERANISPEAKWVFTELPQGSHVYGRNQAVVDSILSHPNAVDEGISVEVGTIPATGVKVDSTSLSLEKGSKKKIMATMSPYYATDIVTWESSNPKVATVSSDGTVSAVGSGTVKITARVGKYNSVCNVSVTASMKGISLNQKKIELARGKQSKLKVNYNPVDTTDSRVVKWSSSNSKVATVSSDGTVTAKGTGKAVITAKVGVYTATCEVVVGVPLERLVLNKSKTTLDKGRSEKLSVSFVPADTTDSKKISWKSYNPEIATVSEDGVVTAVDRGTAQIEARVGFHIETCTVTVNVPLKSISLNAKDISLKEDDVYFLKVSYAPENTTDSTKVTWSSSDPSVASISPDGLVDAKKKGTTEIKATIGKYSAVCRVNVSEKEKVKSADTLVVRRGNTYYFKYSLSNGVADLTFNYGGPNDQILIGDWDGDGIDTLCYRRGNEYYFKSSLTGGEPDYMIHYGRVGDEVYAGDWDGDGKDTLCVRRGNKYFIKNSIAGGVADVTVPYGRVGDKVLIGDWDGDGKDTICVRRGHYYYFKNSLTSGVADSTISYGWDSDQILVGDWDGDEKDTLCVRRGKEYHIKNSIKSGPADKVVLYGRAGDITYVGTWR